MIGLVSRLLEHSFVDGPGNRAVVFLQGCPLRCLYCHNPQTQQVCHGCGLCIDGCPGEALSPGVGPGQPLAWDPARCQGCDRCIQVCPHRADPRATGYSPEQLAAWLGPVAPFISGITVSGGEPMLQVDFLIALFQRVRSSRLTTMIETSATVEPARFDQLLPYLDGALVDLKAWDDPAHQALTGASNRHVAANIERLAGLGKLVEVRLPVVPGYSDTEEQVGQAAAFLAGLDPALPVKLQRFRTHGTMGAAREWAPPSDELIDRLLGVARAAGLTRVTRSR